MDDHAPPPGPEGAGDFVPLRLRVQGSEVGVDLTRPDMVLGRHTDTDVRLPLPDVSRRHCRFVFADRRWQLFDLNSLNGVYVNGERVTQAVLRHHDVVRIGSYTFEVDTEAAGKTLRFDPAGPLHSPLVLQRIQGLLTPPEGLQRQAS